MTSFKRLITCRDPLAQAFIAALGLDSQKVLNLMLHFNPEEVVQVTVTLAVDAEQAEGLVSALQTRSYALVELLDVTEEDAEQEFGIEIPTPIPTP